jgi:tetratricopeptide (TPR) repeat protein
MYLLLKTHYAQAVGRKDEALKTARKALQLYPADPEIMIQLASLLFAGPEEGHQEAVGLCTEVLRQLSAPPVQNDQGSGGLAYSPLQKLLRKQAEAAANRYLLQEAYNHQEWYRAAALLDSIDSAKLDKAMVATILRKSGKIMEAVQFASSWYREYPNSENAAEAYLRSLAAAGTGSGVAAVSGSAMPDTGLGILLSAGQYGLPGTQPSMNPLVGIVLSMLSGTTSTQMRSYLLYLKGTLQTDDSAAIESYRAALLEKADNVEAMIALAKTYARMGDKPKALYYVRQAMMIGIQDADLALEAKALEASLSS